MNLLNVIIILFILLCMVTGLKRGFIKETVNVVGNVVILIISFLFMNSLATILYQFLPFINLGLLDISLSALNILVYQIISFGIIYFILNAILRIIISLTNIIDKLINALVIIRPVSSFLGMIVGFISGYVITFIILLILSIPFSTNNTFYSSSIGNFILEKTPIFASLTTNIRNTTKEIYSLANTIKNDNQRIKNSNQYNLEVLDIMLKHKLISVETIDNLIEQGKLGDIKNINKVLNKYR